MSQIPIAVQDFKDFFTKGFTYSSTAVQDADITKAITVADAQFLYSAFDVQNTLKIAFLYLTAHYLQLDINPVSMSSGIGFTSSISTMDISESKTIPEWIQKNPIYMDFASTGYGMKYISFIESRRSPVVFFEGYNDDF